MRTGAVGLALVAVLALPSAGASSTSACPRDARLGTVAFVRDGALRVVSLADCRERVLVERGATPPVRFSADGRYVAYGSGHVVPAAGGPELPPLVAGIAWEWSPRGALMAGITARGGVVLRGPGGDPRRLLPDGWGASSLVWDRSGRTLVVVRSARRPPLRHGIWLYHLGTGATQLVAGGFPDTRRPVLAAVSPGEPWLLWWPFYDSAVSANADGVPLMAKRIAGGAGPLRLAPRMLATTGFMTWCGSRLVFAAGFDRYTTNGKRLLAAGAPLWRSRELSRDRTRSWVSPACSPDGRRLAVSAGRNWVESRFGLERRSIWILSPDGRSRRRLTAPPAGRTDEVPRWSADGRAVLFVRSGPTAGNATARGFLYVVRPGAAPLGPIVDLGRTGNYYGQYGWAGQTDWFEPR